MASRAIGRAVLRALIPVAIPVATPTVRAVVGVLTSHADPVAAGAAAIPRAGRITLGGVTDAIATVAVRAVVGRLSRPNAAHPVAANRAIKDAGRHCLAGRRVAVAIATIETVLRTTGLVFARAGVAHSITAEAAVSDA